VKKESEATKLKATLRCLVSKIALRFLSAGILNLTLNASFYMDTLVSHLICDDVHRSVQYPHLVHAAIASSAPVRAIVDFQGYNDVVAKSLTTDLVGGSQKVRLSIY